MPKPKSTTGVLGGARLSKSTKQSRMEWSMKSSRRTFSSFTYTDDRQLHRLLSNCEVCEALPFQNLQDDIVHVYHGDHREVLVHVDLGDDDVVEVDVHQPLFKGTLLLAGILQTPKFMQRQLICENSVPAAAIPWPRAAPAAERFERDLPIPTEQWMHETTGF